MASATGKREGVYLIGHYEDDIKGAKLPSIRQALGHFLYLHNEKHKTTRESAKTTIEKIIEFWVKAAIPTKSKQHCIIKIEKLFSEWKNLKKSKNRRTDTQTENENKLVDQLENLFDIALENAEDMIQNDADKAFLLAQREPGRRGSMASVDKVTQRESEKKRMKEKKQDLRQKKAKLELCQAKETASLDFLSDASSSPRLSEEEFIPKIRKEGNTMKNIITQELCSTLDRNKVSDMSAAMIIGETVKSMDEPLRDKKTLLV